jgi:hypothetical protein
MEDGKKKIIFLEDAHETQKDGSEFEETPQFPDTTGGSSKLNTLSNKSVEEPNQEVSPKLVGGNQNESEISETPDLLSLKVTDGNSDNISEYSEDGLISEGGASSVSDVSSVSTGAILSVDPLYIRLTKFLEADVKLEGGSSKKVNVVEVLQDISSSLKDITKSLSEMATHNKKVAVEKLTQ